MREENDLQIDYYRDLLEHFAVTLDKHAVCKIVLGYIRHLDGFEDEASDWWSKARQDFEDPAVQKDFGKYLEWKNEAPIQKYLEFIENSTNRLH